MAVTSKWYGLAFSKAFNKEIDLDTDTIRVLLLTAGYTPDQDTHDYHNDLTTASNEVTSSGYTAGGYTLANKAVAYSTSTNIWNFDNTVDPPWTGVTFTTRYAVFYEDTAGASSTDPLISYVDFGGDQTVAAANFTLQLSTEGIVKVTVS